MVRQLVCSTLKVPIKKPERFRRLADSNLRGRAGPSTRRTKEMSYSREPSPLMDLARNVVYRTRQYLKPLVTTLSDAEDLGTRDEDEDDVIDLQPVRGGASQCDLQLEPDVGHAEHFFAASTRSGCIGLMLDDRLRELLDASEDAVAAAEAAFLFEEKSCRGSSDDADLEHLVVDGWIAAFEDGCLDASDSA